MKAGRHHQSPRGSYHMTDLGNSQRFVEQFGSDIRYCHDWGHWFHWDGKRWAKDDTGGVIRLAKRTALGMYSEAMHEDDVNRRKALVGHALSTEAYRRIKSMIELAQSEPKVPVRPTELDLDPWLLNCENGTIDLRTGELRDHRREDHITKIVPIEYHADRTCPRWDQFLSEIMGNDEDLVGFLKRMIGYSLTGSTREQFFLILHGVGGNGKSTLIEILKIIIGEYSTTSSMDAFIEQKHGGGVPNDIARLRGARFVSAIETDAMKYLAEGKLKALTGQDMISARFLFHEFFEFIPQFKLWLACNHKPIVKGTDHAMWRRIRLLPFNMTFDPSVEPDLKEKLESELEGIFAQAIAEAVLWVKEGVITPPGVVEATGEYRTEMDVIGGFLEARCDISPHESEKMAVIYGEYEYWCNSEKEKPVSKRAFGLAMRERGFNHRRGTGGVKFYCGLKLKTSLKQHGIAEAVEVRKVKQSKTQRSENRPELIKKVTEVTDKGHFPISPPTCARARSIPKPITSVPSVTHENTEKPRAPKVDPAEHHAQRMKMSSSEARLLRQIFTRGHEDNGKPVPFSVILTISGLHEKYLKDMIITSRKADRLGKAQSEPEPGYLVTKVGLKAIMEFEAGVDQ
jgi:putative DNA primase/helicase